MNVAYIHFWFKFFSREDGERGQKAKGGDGCPGQSRKTRNKLPIFFLLRFQRGAAAAASGHINIILKLSVQFYSSRVPFWYDCIIMLVHYNVLLGVLHLI